MTEPVVASAKVNSPRLTQVPAPVVWFTGLPTGAPPVLTEYGAAVDAPATDGYRT
ncbi:hypothetical protein [Kribbella qitaiheensis]|uniref:hypothetical protein n=1 Tax=Kribbella qitaiheensis TaxID=1544730 RepID=UPI0036D3E211